MSTHPGEGGCEPRPRHASPGPAPTGLLVFLAVVLVIVEAAPLVLMGASHGIWPLNNFEDFSTAFWAPLKVGYAPSYYFNQSGYYFGGILKVVHSVTDLAIGSKIVTYRHLQYFGYLSRALFCVLTLGVVAGYWRRRRDAISAVSAAALLLAFRLGAPFIVQIYHLRVGLQLTYVLLMLLLSLATIEAMGRFLEGESPTPGFLAYAGILCGACLFEAPHYLPFFLPLFMVVMARAGSTGALGGRVARWAGGCLLGSAAGLVALYGLDYRSELAAVFSNIRGIVVGFPQPQPGFEKFPNLELDPSNAYFPIKIGLAIQLAAIAVFAVTAIATWRRQDRRFRFGAAVILGSFAVVWLVHVRIWRTHGSYTTVFSLYYYGFLTCALILQSGWRAWQIGGRSRLTATATIMASCGLLIPCASTLWTFPYRATYDNDRAYGESFRSFNAFLGRLPGPQGLAFNQNISYFPLIAHCNFSQIMYHMGSTTGYADLRFADRIQSDRYPGYRLLYFYRVISAKYHWGAAHLDAAVDQGFPPMNSPTLLVPLPQATGAANSASLEGNAHFIPVESIPQDRTLGSLLVQHPDWAPEDVVFGSLRWSFTPVGDRAVLDRLLKGVWPINWSRSGRLFYFVDTPAGYYVVAVSVPPGVALKDSGGQPAG